MIIPGIKHDSRMAQRERNSRAQSHVPIVLLQLAVRRGSRQIASCCQSPEMTVETHGPDRRGSWTGFAQRQSSAHGPKPSFSVAHPNCEDMSIPRSIERPNVAGVFCVEDLLVLDNIPNLYTAPHG